MEGVGKWDDFVEKTSIGFYFAAVFRGIGQVFFQENALSGLIILGGVFYGSVFCGIAGLIGVLASTITAVILGVSKKSILQGLYGFNGVLVGIALATFLKFDALLVTYIIFGGILSTIVMAAFSNVLGKLGVPALTAPFVLTTWLLLFGVFLVTGINPGNLISPSAVTRVQGEPIIISAVLKGFSTNIAEVMFQSNIISGLIILIGVLVNSVKSAFLAVVGSVVSIAVAMLLGGLNTVVSLGLYGFNGVLSCIAIGTIFLEFSLKSVLYSVLAAVTATIVYLSISVFLQPFGMPAVTAPFVLATWLFLWAKTDFNQLD